MICKVKVNAELIYHQNSCTGKTNGKPIWDGLEFDTVIMMLSVWSQWFGRWGERARSICIQTVTKYAKTSVTRIQINHPNELFGLSFLCSFPLSPSVLRFFLFRISHSIILIRVWIKWNLWAFQCVKNQNLQSAENDRCPTKKHTLETSERQIIK